MTMTEHHPLMPMLLAAMDHGCKHGGDNTPYDPTEGDQAFWLRVERQDGSVLVGSAYSPASTPLARFVRVDVSRIEHNGSEICFDEPRPTWIALDDVRSLSVE